MNFCNKLECLSLASLSRLVYCLWVSPESTRVKPLGTNFLAYQENLLITAVKSYAGLAPALHFDELKTFD